MPDISVPLVMDATSSLFVRWLERLLVETPLSTTPEVQSSIDEKFRMIRKLKNNRNLLRNRRIRRHQPTLPPALMRVRFLRHTVLPRFQPIQTITVFKKLLDSFLIDTYRPGEDDDLIAGAPSYKTKAVVTAKNTLPKSAQKTRFFYCTWLTCQD